ncbi:MAG: GntR family transcriptional regulator [Propionibacteriaceae bacterium]|nr:GntR family transcriptional regulator [Propionibacteriaceae bacterium]
MKYLRVREHLRRRVQGMREGESLPSEAELCGEYGVSRITVRRAVDDLAKDGLVVKEQGRGTFVTRPRVAQKYSERFAETIQGFYGEMVARGEQVGTRVLRQRVVFATADLAGSLMLAPTDELVELVRLRSVNGEPNHVVYTYLPCSLFPATATADFSTGSLYEFLRSEYAADLHAAHLTIEVVLASDQEADLLELSPAAPLLQVSSRVSDATGKPLLFGFSRLRPDSSQLEIDVVSRKAEERVGS